MLTLWPVFLRSVVQEDVVRLFELDDVLTLPVELVDAAAQPRWPRKVGVETTVRLTSDDRGRSWATTSSGLSVLTHLDQPAKASVSMRAALSVPIETTALLSFVTGTVHRIEIASVTRPGACWALSETPVAPVCFRRGGRDRVEPWDEGILVHLDLLSPRCRCREIAELQGNEASRYARRHLRATAEDHQAETTNYVCPELGVRWIRHRWKRKRYPGDPPGVPYEPMLLTRQSEELGEADD